jgi:hypothetical protein
MKNPPRARLGYARATGERRGATGALLPCAAHAVSAGICHQFLWTVSQPFQFRAAQVARIDATKGAVRRGANSETASEPSQVQGQFRALHRCSYPEGYGCYCTTRTQRSVRESAKTLQKARPTQSAGRAKDGRSVERRGMATTRQPSELGAVPQTGITQLQVESSLRGKRLDPSHGANARLTGVAVPVVKVPERTVFLQASQHPSGERTTGRWSPNRA